jgi:uncharacterized repeat protein (TIGR01451 family)
MKCHLISNSKSYGRILSVSIIALLMVMAAIAPLLHFTTSSSGRILSVMSTEAGYSASIWTTDEYGNPKTDFAPGDIVYIHGTGFLSWCNVDIDITRPNCVVDSGSTMTNLFGSLVYEYDLDGILGFYFVVASDGINLAQTIFTDNHGAIWTTRDDCGDQQQDVNHYDIGESVFINGKDFTPEAEYEWFIKGKPGGASCDPNIIVASGTVIANESGTFCFDAYEIQSDDCGEYSVKVDSKNDNYHVNAPWPDEPNVDIEKQVWNASTSSWMDSAAATVCTNLPFRINVTNTGNVDLTNVVVVDDLPSFLTYNYDASPSPSSASDHQIVWNLGTLTVGSSQILTFNAHVDACGFGDNIANVTTDNGVYDEDYISVEGLPIPSVDVEKKVWNPDTQSWVESIDAFVGSTVRFNISIHNDGICSGLMSNTVIDALPPSLDYADDAIPHEPVENGKQLTWSFPGPFLVCNWIYIEFNATVLYCGELDINVVNVSAQCMITSETVYDEDTASVFGLAAPNIPPTVSITSPSDGATVSGSDSISGTASDSDGSVTLVEYRVDSGSWISTSGTTSWSAIWDSTSVSDGSHTIDARSKDNDNAYSTLDSVTVTVDNNIPPTAAYTWVDADAGGTGTLIDFDASGSSDDNGITTYEWDWDNDGSYDYTGGPTASHDYGDCNAHDCTLRVTDTASQTDTMTKTVRANAGNPPVADANGPYTANEGNDFTVTLDGSGSYDPDGNIKSYEWDFDGDGTYDWTSTSTGITTHTYTPTEHSYDINVKLRVTDNNGLTDTDTSVVHVVSHDDDPPIVQLEYPRGGEELSGTIVIKWFALDSENWGSPSIWLYYTADGGHSWVRIAKDLENTIGDGFHKDRGEYSWNTGSLPDGNYIVRIYAYNKAGNSAKDTSKPFIIGIKGSGLMVSYVTVGSSNAYIKNGDSLTIEAGITFGQHISADYVTADLSGLGRGTSVPADSFDDGLTATWTVTDVECTPSDGPITITVTATDGGSTSSNTATIIADNTIPELNVITPENALYFQNKKLFSLNKPIIIGALTLEVTADDSSGVQKTEVYIDDELKETLTGGSEWYMNLRLMGRHTLKIVAYDNAGNINEYPQTVIIINPFGEK